MGGSAGSIQNQAVWTAWTGCRCLPALCPATVEKKKGSCDHVASKAHGTVKWGEGFRSCLAFLVIYLFLSGDPFCPPTATGTAVSQSMYISVVQEENVSDFESRGVSAGV